MRSPRHTTAYRSISFMLAILLFLASFVSALNAPIAYASPGEGVSEISVPEEASSLSPDDPEVDATRIVAWPKESTNPEEVEESVIEVVEDMEASEETSIDAEIIANPGADDFESLVIVEGDEQVTEDLIDQMMATGLFETVDYDVLIDPLAVYTATPNDTLYPSAGSWGLKPFPGANFSAVWARLDLARGKSDTAPIAMIDTGFDLTLEDRGPNIVAAYDFALFRSSVTPQSRTQLAYHGTSTAGVIGAATNNKKGVAGAAWDNKVIIYKATDANDNLYLSAVTNSVNDVVAKRNARIINMSLGGTAFPSYFQMAIDSAVNSGILVVAAAGNTAQQGNVTLYPAAYPPVLSVASIGPTGAWSSFSTYNSEVNIAAPGEQISVLRYSNTYSYASGTSFAAPHVSAAAALVWRAAPNLSAAQVKNILINTAKPIGTKGNTKTGAGALDAAMAYETALGLPFQPKITRVDRGRGNVKLTWSYNTNSPHSVTGYVLWYRASSQKNWSVRNISTQAKQYSYTVGGLKDNTKYYFKVAALTTKGKGPFSTYVEGTTYPPSVLSSKQTMKIRRGQSAWLYVAPHYCVRRSQKVTWKSSNPRVATVSNLGKAAMKKGSGAWTGTSLTDKAVARKGRKLVIKGERKGTCYLTFSSSGATRKVKVVVY
ncbi:MAG: S8 family serine peptidase [Coriobacteriia bacterium]|nr:S8 family serine peptidase [Coriobacteriia bacterium]MCL2870316.1 S8 family serine peptidase [Coriobacteriia bacterium]